MPAPDRSRFFARAKPQERTPIVAEAPAPKVANGVAVLRLYDRIDWDGEFWGVSAKEFTAVLDALPENVTTIELHINSPGGMVWDGLAIMNALRQHKAQVVVIVDGLAASAASFIAMAGDEIVMAPGAEMMVHAPMGLCVGNAADMEKMAGALAHEADNLARIYADRAGGTVEEWRAVMDAETWFSDQEAVAAGLADRVLDQEPAADQPKARFDLSVFAYAGRAKAPAPHAPVSTAGGSITHEGGSAVAFSDEQITGLRQRLGVADDADEATILAALDEALTEKADPPPTDENKPEIPEGHVIVPEARLRDLEAGVAASAGVAKKMHDQERDAFLNSVRTKYAPANRQAWANEYDRDPEGTRTHFETAPEIIALTPLGHDDDAEGADAEYYALFPDEKKAG